MADTPAVVNVLALALGAFTAGAIAAYAYRTRAAAAHREHTPMRLAWENSTDMMAILRVAADGGIYNDEFNPAFRAWYRRATPEITEADIKEHDIEWVLRVRLGHPEERIAAILAPHREAVRTGKPVATSAELPVSGEKLYRQAVFTPIFGAGGRVTHLFYRATDITELRRAEARFRLILERTPAMVAITGRDDGRFRYVNPAWSRMTGYPQSAGAELDVMQLGVWSSEDSRRTAIAPLLERGETVQFERTLRARDGRLVRLLYSALPFDHEGEACILAIGQDITELTEVRARAEAMTAHFERVFRLIPHPIAIATVRAGRLLEVNDAWLQLYGLERGAAAGRTVGELRIWEDPGERTRLIERVSAGETVTGYRARFRTPRGIAHAIVSAERISWKGESALIVATLDVTELHHATDEIRRLNDSLESRVRERTAELERAVKEQESFSYSVSHDLRAPLRHIAGFTRMIVEDGNVRPGTEAARFAERAAAAATRLGTLIDELLDYSRLGRKPLTMVDTDLSRTVASVLEEVGAGLAGRRIEWDIAQLPRVHGDPALLRLVMQNLIENAVKYTGKREAARIAVGARQEDREDTVWVRDNGIGFDMQYSGKLFGVFQRMHTEAEFEGTGIGLANAKRIVERHGGRIWFEAVPERGATFYFTLPRRSVQAGRGTA